MSASPPIASELWRGSGLAWSAGTFGCINPP
jgi:hypothetical protein